MRWLAALIVSAGLVPAVAADDGEEALALTLELISQITQSADLAVVDQEALTARLDSAFDAFEQEAEARGAQWSMSWGIDVDAKNHQRHDPEGNPLPLDPETFEEDDFLPPSRVDCADPVHHPLSPGSTARAHWVACSEIEDDGDGEGPYYIGVAELLYGQDGNFNRVRLAVAVTSSDAGYIDAMSGPATELLYALMNAIQADAITPWPILGRNDGE